MPIYRRFFRESAVFAHPFPVGRGRKNNRKKSWNFDKIANMWTTLSIAGFGLLGIFSRYGLDTFALSHGQSKAIVTLSINILGSFLAGFLVGFSPFGLDRPWKVGIVVGFCGGFTTFSGFSLQLLDFYTKGETQMAFLLGVVSPLLCFLGVFLGYLLGKQFVSY